MFIGLLGEVRRERGPEPFSQFYEIRLLLQELTFFNLFLVTFALPNFQKIQFLNQKGEMKSAQRYSFFARKNCCFYIGVRNIQIDRTGSLLGRLSRPEAPPPLQLTEEMEFSELSSYIQRAKKLAESHFQPRKIGG